VNKFKNLCLIVFAIILIFYFSSACGVVGGNPDGPDDTEKVEYYSYTVTYMRPPGSIVRPERAEPIAFIVQNKNGAPSNLALTKVSDYEFTGTILSLPTHLKKDKALLPNYIYVVDAQRWIDIWAEDNGQMWGRPYSVGDIFKLKNNTTGAELILNNIVPNPILLPVCPSGCNPLAAQFWTIKGGTPYNAWPYQ